MSLQTLRTPPIGQVELKGAKTASNFVSRVLSLIPGGKCSDNSIRPWWQKPTSTFKRRLEATSEKENKSCDLDTKDSRKRQKTTEQPLSTRPSDSADQQVNVPKKTTAGGTKPTKAKSSGLAKPRAKTVY